MNNEDKILEMLTAMQARQEKSEELLGVMQASMQSMQSDIQKINGRLDSMDERLDSMDGRLNSLEEKVDDLAEGQDELRTSVNALLDWSERVSSIEQLRIPKIG